MLGGRISSLEAQVNAIFTELRQNDQELLGYIKSGEEAQNQTRQLAAERFLAAEAQIIQLRTMLFAQERRLAILLSTIRKSVSGQPEDSQAQSIASDGMHDLDNLYLMLEDQLRGSRADITSRLTKYLPYLEDAERGKYDGDTFVADERLRQEYAQSHPTPKVRVLSTVSPVASFSTPVPAF